MDESLASAVIDVGGRPYAVIDLPFRGERVGELPLQLIEHALESFAEHLRQHAPPVRPRPQRPSPGRGRHQGPGPRPAPGLRAGSAPGRRGVHQGLARMSGPTIAVVDYGAGNLVSIEQALTRVGATVTVARDPDALRGADALVVPGVGAARPAMERLARARPGRAHPGLDRGRTAVPGHLPRPAAPVRGQRRGRCRDARRARRPDGPPRGRPDPPPHRLEPGRAGRRRIRSSPASMPTRTSTSCTRTWAPRPTTRSSRPRPSTAGRSCRPWPAGRCWASSSTPNGAATTACACWPTSRGLVAAAAVAA